MVFTFKLYGVNYTDADGDGILNKDEYDTDPTLDLGMIDTDGDHIPNYLDTDDDGDGTSTRLELRIPNDNPSPTNPVQYYSFENIPTCTGGTKKRHLDPNCYN